MFSDNFKHVCSIHKQFTLQHRGYFKNLKITPFINHKPQKNALLTKIIIISLNNGLDVLMF